MILNKGIVAHLPTLIIDLGVILAAAAISTLVFSKFKQPIVLGYLIAGFAVGPYFPLWPTVVDHEGVKLWAEVGVIFLLFGLGLEFSFKKLAKVGRSASIAALFEIITMTGVGYLFGRAFGWSSMDSVFLGTILSMSSTTIIIRAFGEAGLKGKGFVNLVFGILIVEDLMAILLMVLLTAISVPGEFSWSNLAFLTARLGFFLLIWFIVGIYFLPTLLNRIRPLLSAEILLIVAVGLCFLMVVLASKTGFSAAIGAFIMGSILAETKEGERIEHLIEPVKNLFGAVFFVSVGMMIDPAVLREHFGVVILITLLTVIGKLLGSGFGAVLSGRSLKQSVQAGMSLAQIGEFSFIIATLGMTLKVTSDFLYPIVVAVSAVTTFTTPYMIRHSGSIYDWIEARLPGRFTELLEKYERAMSRPDPQERPLRLLWRIYGPAAILNSVVVIAIGLASALFLLPKLVAVFGDGWPVRLLACVATLTACAPFLYAVALKSPRKLSTERAVTLERLRNLQFGALLLRVTIALVLIAATISQFSTTFVLPLVVLVAAPIALVSFRKGIERFYVAVEDRFLSNLNARELAAIESIGQLPQLAPWNATLAQVRLTSEAAVAGDSLEETKFRTRTGATVAMIDRGERRIFAPDRAERLLPNDVVFLIGTDEQLAAAHAVLEAKAPAPADSPDEKFDLESFLIGPESAFIGKSIREIGMNEELGAMIVGIERNGTRMLNPESSEVLVLGDVVWVFGARNRLRRMHRKRP